MKRKNTKVVVRKLGREKAYGIAYSNNEVHIDPRQGAKDMMDTFIHEQLHIIFPETHEEEIKRVSGMLTNFLWELNYRKVVNS